MVPPRSVTRTRLQFRNRVDGFLVTNLAFARLTRISGLDQVHSGSSQFNEDALYSSHVRC